MTELTIHKDQQMPFVSHLLYMIKGAIVGTGAILPGISGGVLCVAFGIYEPFMEILSNPAKNLKKHRSMLVPFVLGWTAGFILLAGAVEKFFEAAPVLAMMLFAGLITGTIPQMLSDAEQEEKTSWSFLILSFIGFTVLFRLLKTAAAVSIEPDIFWYFFCGAVWGLSLIIPGLSSSSLLILLGLYQPMTAGIAALDLSVLVPLGLGMALTALTLSRAAAALFAAKRGMMLKIICGIMLASALCIIPELPADLTLLYAPAVFAAGYGTARCMDRKQNQQNCR